MGNLQRVIYSPLHEEEVSDHTGWQKETVDYVLANRSKIFKQIRGISKGTRKSALQQSDVEDIYQDILCYLYGADDYNLDKAVEHSNGNGIISVEGYVNVCLKHCVQRACSQINVKERELISEVVTDDDNKELNIFNTVADPKADVELELFEYDLRTLCKSYECLRYRFGPDLYLVLYIRLLCGEKSHDELYREILSMLGISKRDLSELDTLNEESVMLNMTKAITVMNLEEAIHVLHDYVFSADRIANLIQNYIA